MSKFRKLMAIATLLFASSSVFVACSDDDPSQLGPIGINAVVTTAKTAYVQWTIVSGDFIDAYKVTLREGGRDGQVVEEVTRLPKETHYTFQNLKPDTVYSVATQGQLTSNSGFSSAGIAYRQFMTAPLVETTGVSTVVKMNKEVDDDGNIIEVPRAEVNVKFQLQDALNCGNYRVRIYEGVKTSVVEADKPTMQAIVQRKVAADGATFWPLKLNTTYTIVTNAVSDGASCWYIGNADPSYYTYTTPAQ